MNSVSRSLVSPFATTVEWLTAQNYATWHKPVTTSTNDIAKESCSNLKGISYFLTDHQTHGRGRNTNGWLDKASTQLMLSVAIPLTSPPPLWTTLNVGSIIFSALKKSWDLNLSLKAPNDILVNGKKMIGILTEMITQGDQHWLIIGFGFNVFSHPPDVSATCLLDNSQNQKIMTNDWINFLKSLTDSFAQLPDTLTIGHSIESLAKKLKDCQLHHPDYGTFIEFMPGNKLKFQEKVISWSDL
jgi:biotin-[acetyl-CoA-carboxylase] ligase BirA-like protein